MLQNLPGTEVNATYASEQGKILQKSIEKC